MLAVVGEQHAFVADEEDAAVPFADEGIVLPHVGFVRTLMPVELARGHVATRAVFINSMHGGRGNIGMWWRTESFDAERRIEFQRPERQIVPMAAEIGHGAIAEIPPAIPLWSGK